jgi:hypothetical protein
MEKNPVRNLARAKFRAGVVAGLHSIDYTFRSWRIRFAVVVRDADIPRLAFDGVHRGRRFDLEGRQRLVAVLEFLSPDNDPAAFGFWQATSTGSCITTP